VRFVTHRESFFWSRRPFETLTQPSLCCIPPRGPLVFAHLCRLWRSVLCLPCLFQNLPLLSARAALPARACFRRLPRTCRDPHSANPKRSTQATSLSTIWFTSRPLHSASNTASTTRGFELIDSIADRLNTTLNRRQCLAWSTSVARSAMYMVSSTPFSLRKLQTVNIEHQLG